MSRFTESTKLTLKDFHTIFLQGSMHIGEALKLANEFADMNPDYFQTSKQKALAQLPVPSYYDGPSQAVPFGQYKNSVENIKELAETKRDYCEYIITLKNNGVLWLYSTYPSIYSELYFALK